MTVEGDDLLEGFVVTLARLLAQAGGVRSKLLRLVGGAQYGQFSRRIGVPPVLADGLPACRFIGGQAGRAVFPHRRDACFPIKKR